MWKIIKYFLLITVCLSTTSATPVPETNMLPCIERTIYRKSTCDVSPVFLAMTISGLFLSGALMTCIHAIHIGTGNWSVCRLWSTFLAMAMIGSFTASLVICLTAI